MAQANRITTSIEKTVTEEVVKIVLELTPEEATALEIILRSVGGDPSYTPRPFTDGIQRALASSRGPIPVFDSSVLFERGSGAIYWKNHTVLPPKHVAAFS